MPSKKTLAPSVVVAAATSGAGGFYVGKGVEAVDGLREFARSLSRSYFDSATRVQKDVAYLRLLRSGDKTAATAQMKAALDGEISWLATYTTYTPERGRCAHVYDALDAAREYRTSYPSTIPAGRQRDDVAKALAMRRETLPAGNCSGVPLSKDGADRDR